MRLYYLTVLTILCTIFASASAPVSAEIITYKFEGVVTNMSIPFGPIGSDVVGYFAYKDDLPVNLSTAYSTSYGLKSHTEPPDIYFQIYGETGSVFSTKSFSHYAVYNDYGFDIPSTQTFDGVSIYGTRLLSSPDSGMPSSIQLGVFLRDYDYSIFDSMDLPTELPPLTEFENSSITLFTSPIADITSLTRINNGDLNGDGFVGVEDLNAVLSHWNQDAILGDRQSGNPNNDDFVGIEDLNIVLGNWNAGSPPNNNANIPEPATIALLSLGFALTHRRR